MALGQNPRKMNERATRGGVTFAPLPLAVGTLESAGGALGITQE